MRKIRKINWTPEAKMEKKITPPHPLVPERPIEEYINHESLKAGMEVGALWFTHCRLSEDKRWVNAGYLPHEFPYIAYSAFDKPMFPPQTPAIYMGTVRVEEESRNGNLTRVLRHSFLIGGRRFLTYDIGKCFYPA